MKRVGKLWRLGSEEIVLQLSKIACLQSTVKLIRDQPGPFVVLKANFLGRRHWGELIPEVVSTRALQ